MANLRQLDRRRKSIRNIRKITRTMELIATARFKRALDRVQNDTAYTEKITELVSHLAGAGLGVKHPLLEPREETRSATLLVLTANRGLCGGYNANVQREAVARWRKLASEVPSRSIEVSGKRGIGGLRFRGIDVDRTFTHFEDKPTFDEVDELAGRYLEEYLSGQLDRLDVAYMRFDSASRQTAVCETLLPLGSLAGADADHTTVRADYEFLPSAESILQEIVPTSFKVKLFKCFLDAAVSEQISRMVAMKSATENADGLIKRISMVYNRARQNRITSDLLDVLGGVEALSN